MSNRAILLLVVASLALRASYLAAATLPPWSQLTAAYPARRDGLIDHYAQSKTQSVRLYARALKALAAQDVERLDAVAQKCAAAQVVNDADSAAYFGCLFAAATGFGVANRPKKSYLWTAKVIAFYDKHRSAIDRATGTSDPAGVSRLRVPSANSVEKWPYQTSKVDAWSNIPMRDGMVQAYVDNKPIKMEIDTGSSGLMLSRNDVEKYNLKSKLISLNTGSVGLDYSNGFTSKLYYVKSFEFGPVTIRNAYISVYSGDSVIGINALEALEHFSISADKITRGMMEHGASCSPMMRERHTVTQAFQLPFFRVHTTAGDVGLLLDSGLHMHGSLGDVGVRLAPRAWAKLPKYPAGNGVGVTHSVLVQNGKKSYSSQRIFDFSIAGISTSGYTATRNPDDPMVYGVMDFAMLGKAIVSYDFKGGKMCIRPVSHRRRTSASGASNGGLPE